MTPIEDSPAHHRRAKRLADASLRVLDWWARERLEEALMYFDNEGFREFEIPLKLRGGVRPAWTSGKVRGRIAEEVPRPPSKDTILKALDWLCGQGLIRREMHGKRPVYRWRRLWRLEDSLALGLLGALRPGHVEVAKDLLGLLERGRGP